MQDYDAARLFDIIDRDRHHLGRFLPWPPKIRTLEDELKFVRTMTGAWDEQSAFCYCVAPTVEADVVGVITAFSFSWHDECVELGYWLGSDSVGHGYATGAVRLLERALFDAGLNRIEIRCEPDNPRSIAVAERCDYRLEGRLRQGVKHSQGDYRDVLVYGKLRNEYIRTDPD